MKPIPGLKSGWATEPFDLESIEVGLPVELRHVAQLALITIRGVAHRDVTIDAQVLVKSHRRIGTDNGVSPSSLNHQAIEGYL